MSTSDDGRKGLLQLVLAVGVGLIAWWYDRRGRADTVVVEGDTVVVDQRQETEGKHD